MKTNRTLLQKFAYVYQQFVYFVHGKTSFDTNDLQGDVLESDRTFKDSVQTLLCAFNRQLFGPSHPQFAQAKTFLERRYHSALLNDLAAFLSEGVAHIGKELAHVVQYDADFVDRLNRVYEQLTHDTTALSFWEKTELFWQIFFPEGVGILGQKEKAEERLRQKRSVTIRQKAENPIENPAAEILFTANVLLTVPLKSWNIDDLPLDAAIKHILKEKQNAPQEFWYDHPVPIGIPDENNEILHGLHGLNAMMAFEKQRGTVDEKQKLNVVLSCSVTHAYLQGIAKDYLRQVLERAGNFEHLNVFLFTEADVCALVDLVLWPAFRKAFGEAGNEGDTEIFSVFGVDGPYGRHYSFLKAIALFWKTFIDPKIKATFKIDLDQVFDEEHLLDETGLSALEHFKTPLWGAEGLDVGGKAIHLGMVAGALVNAKDIDKSLFTPDVPYPSGPQSADEYVFFSRLPQALSTRAEMMTRYNGPILDGEQKCLQRVHVTGGTNGILIEALRRFRPFTPSFIGRAEDQAYVLSTFPSRDVPLGYVHKDGLIMRHDKELFMREAIRAAEMGKIIGDYERILYFSYYARALDQNFRRIKERVDPFTGCFISAIPVTVVYLRFVFKLTDLLSNHQLSEAREFMQIGIRRLRAALDFCSSSENHLQKQYIREKEQWEAFYQTMEMLQNDVAEGDENALHLRSKAQEFVEKLRLV